MPSQGWNQTLVTQRAAGTSFGTFTTAKTVINQQDLYSFYPNFFQIGQKLRITACMSIGNLVTTPGTMAFQVMLGSVIAFTTGNVQLNATAHTAIAAKLVVDLTCQLANTGVGGAIAKLMGQAVLTGTMFTKTIAATDSWGRISAADNIVSDVTINLPTTSPALGTAFDGTISQILDFWAGFSISSASNTILMNQYDVEQLN